MGRANLSRTATVAATLLAYAFGANVREVHSDEAPVRQAIVAALADTWGDKQGNRSKADDLFDAIDKVAPGDPAAVWASALVYLSQRRYSDAGKKLDRLLAAEDDHLPGWRAKIWLSVLTKNYGEALSASERALAVLPEADEPADEVEQDFIRFLGRMHGFLAGPMADAVGAAGREDAERRLLARLGEERSALFAKAKEETLAKFEELAGQRDDTKAAVKAEVEEEKQKRLQDVAEARVANESRANELSEKREKLASELERELSTIAREDEPLRSQLSRLQSQRIGVESNLVAIDSDIARLRILFARERDPIIRGQIGFDIDRLSITANRIQAELAGLDRQAAGVNGQRAALAARQQSLQNRLGNQVASIDRELGSIDKADKKLDGTEKKIRRPVSLNKGKVLAMSTQASAWTTYESFPLVAERDRLMTDLR